MSSHLRLVLCICAFLASSCAVLADPVDDRVVALANDLTGPNPSQACKDLDTIRAIYGADKIRPALSNMFVGGCSDQLIQSIPIDDDSLWSYMVAVWNGNGGSRRAYNMLKPPSGVPAPFISKAVPVATSFLKNNANCPSGYLIRIVPTPPTSDGLAAAWAVLRMPPCPAGQTMPGSGFWIAGDEYEDGRANAAYFLRDKLADLKTAFSLSPNFSNPVRYELANNAALTLTCDHAQFVSDQATLDNLAGEMIKLTDLMRNVPPPTPHNASPVTSYVRMLEAIRACNGTMAAQLTTEIQSFLGHPDPTVRGAAGYPPFPSCTCSNW